MSRCITEWNPDDPQFWSQTGRRIARRNLIWSIIAENIGFSVWMVWSVVTTRLTSVGFHYTTDQLFALVSVPGLLGAVMRFPYTFAVPRFGGRNWTVISALLLFIPTTSLIVLVQRPDTPFWLMMVAASTAGLGGGNFASSMANISFFYPDRQKGLALGLNAAGGNIGVSTVQLLVPIVITIGATGQVQLANAGIMWLPLIAIAAVGAFLFMDNLASARSSFRDQTVIARRKHTWIMSVLYIGTFGSFVGYSAAFPLLIKSQFPGVTANLAFLGPLVGSLSRPFGGQLADRIGGARVTFWSFAAMGVVTAGVLIALAMHSFPLFLTLFLVLFITTGIGNGSTFRMIPAIFRAENVRAAQGRGPGAIEAAIAVARRETGAALGFISAIGALGGFFIPQTFGASIRATGGAGAALTAFVVAYMVCVAITWWYYTRTTFMTSRVPSLAVTNV